MRHAREWEQLCQACQKARLPQPRMTPVKLNGWWNVDIPGHYGRASKDPERVISNVMTWVEGYLAGQRGRNIVEIETPETFEGCLLQAACWANEVLNIKGNGGPDDHETLAKAIISVCEGLLRRKNGNQQASD